MNLLPKHISLSEEGPFAAAYRDRTGRMLYIDIARGLCIIVVVWIHISVGPTRFLNNIANPFFYLLSGVFMTPEMEAAKFVRKRFNAIIIPFLAFISLGLISNLLLDDFSGFHDPETLYRYPMRALGNTPLWFIITLVYIMAIVYVVEHWVGNAWLKLLIYLGLTALGWQLSVHRLFGPLYVSQSLLGLPMFVIGYYLSERVKQGRIFSWWLLAACVVPIYWGCHIDLYTNYHQLIYHSWYWPPFLFSLAMTYLLLCTSRILSHLSTCGWLCWLGSSSLYVMGIHDLLVGPVTLWAHDHGYVEWNTPTLYYCALGLAGACIFATISAWLSRFIKPYLPKI